MRPRRRARSAGRGCASRPRSRFASRDGSEVRRALAHRLRRAPIVMHAITSSCVVSATRASSVISPRRSPTMPVGDLEHVLEVVADHDHGHALVGDAADELERRAPLGEPERRGRLVEHDHAGAPAPLPGRWRWPGAGRRRGAAPRRAGRGGGRRRPSAARCVTCSASAACRRTGKGPRRNRIGSWPSVTFADGVEVVAQREVLVDGLDAVARAPSQRRQARPRSPPIQSSPASGVVEAAEDLDERALAGAVVADEAEHLARRDVERDARGVPGRRRTTSRRPRSRTTGAGSSARRTVECAKRERRRPRFRRWGTRGILDSDRVDRLPGSALSLYFTRVLSL